MNHIAIVIDWFGPYNSIAGAQAVARKDYGGGLYMAIGKQRYQKKPATLQYIGIANELSFRVSESHQKLTEVAQSLKIWLGEVASTGIPGRKSQVIDLRLDLAEWAHAYFLELPLNDKKTINPPKYPVTVINRWWFKDYETKRNRRPHSCWPDIIDYWGKEHGARLAWHGRVSGGRCEVWHPEDF